MTMDGAASPLPMVRIVVLTFDGGDLTMACLRSLCDLDWPSDRYEIVLVDNGSLDDVAERVRAEMPDVTVLEPLANLGFAGGCNLGIAHGTRLGELRSAYDHVALVNNDAIVASDWLRRLVDRIGTASNIGGVASKMLFADRFHEVHLAVLEPLAGRRRDMLGVCVSAIRVDGDESVAPFQFDEGFHGPVAPDRARDEEMARWTRDRATIRVPATGASPGTLWLRLNAKRTLTLRVSSGSESCDVVVGAEGETVYTTVEIPISPDVVDVINNVGSELYELGFAGDRGFMERDDGQFDQPCEVFAWCGGAVLLRAAHLDAVGVFDERLFLYYEDTDLAWRGRLAGWRHVYEPGAVVRHHHAQSSGVGSPVFRFHTERNRLLVTARNAPLRDFILALAGETRHCVRVNLALLVKRPLTLKMPSTGEPRHRRAVLAGVLRGVPGALADRRRDRQSALRAGTAVGRSTVVGHWRTRKW
jgi:GT2 family glycosyltransferase